MSFQTNLSCSKHPEKKVEFFAYSVSSKKYELVCSRCISKLPKDTFTVDTEEIFSNNNNYITNWPPLKSEQLQEQIQQKIESQKAQENETETGGNSDGEQMFTKMRSQFQSFLQNLQSNMKNESQSGSQLPHKYQEISQSGKLLSFIKQEVSKKEKFTSISWDFQNFLQQRCQDTSTDQKLEQALKKQDGTHQQQKINKLQDSLKLFYNNYKDFPKKIQQIKQNAALAQQKQKSKKFQEEKPVELESIFDDSFVRTQEYLSMNNFYQKCLGKKKRFVKDHFKHDMEFTLGESVNCTKCGTSPTKNYYWVCQQCKYYLCLDCTQQADQFHLLYEKLVDSRLQKSIKEDRKYQGFVFIFSSPERERNGYCKSCSRKIAGVQKYAWFNRQEQYFLCLVCSQSFSDIILEKRFYQLPDIPKEFFNPNYMQLLKLNQQFVKEVFQNPALELIKTKLNYFQFTVQVQQNQSQIYQNQQSREYKVIKVKEFYKNNVGQLKRFQEIDFRHDLQFIEKYGGSCKQCKRNIKSFCWWCQDCSFYICLDCIFLVQPFKSFYESLKHSQCDEQMQDHQHRLLQFQELSVSIKCTACSQFARSYAWECCDPQSQCLFTFCLNCSGNISQAKLYQNVQQQMTPIMNDNSNNIVSAKSTFIDSGIQSQQNNNQIQQIQQSSQNDSNNQIKQINLESQNKQVVQKEESQISHQQSNQSQQSQQIQVQEEEIIVIEFQQFFKDNLNIYKKFPNIDFKHDLQFIQKNGGKCKMCDRTLTNYCWTCEPCNYFLCIECVSIESFDQYYQKLINSECDEQLGVHRHTKLKLKKFTSMTCDICKKQMQTKYGWECFDPTNKCNFAACIECSSKFGQVLVDTKIYKSLTGQSNQIQNNQQFNQDDEFLVINYNEFYRNNLNLQKKFPNLDFKHELTFIEKDGGYCKMCSRVLKNFSWSCEPCNLHFCIECVTIEPFNQQYQKLINSECDEKLQQHRHTKMSFKLFTNQKCDICGQYSKVKFGWECCDPTNKCNFATCLSCSSKYGDVMVDTKIYKQALELKNQKDEEVMIINYTEFFRNKLNFQKMFPDIDFKHELTFIQKEGGYCKMCSRTLKNFCWSCEQCNLYVCTECLTIEEFNQYYEKLINSQCDENIQQHRHTKMQFKKLSNMICDICKKSLKINYGWQCSDITNKCNFATCVECSSKFGEIMVDAKIYNQQFQLQNQQDEEFIIVNYSDFYKNNLNIQKKFPNLDFKHDLTFIQKDGGYCKMCSRTLKNFCWSCEQCSLYVCIECLNIEPFNQHYQQLINSECDEKLQNHRHTKMKFKKTSSPIKCDICGQYSKNQFGWGCSDPVNKCNFSTCLSCSSKFGEIIVDIKIYKQQPESTPQDSQNNKGIQLENQQDDGIIIINYYDFYRSNLNLQKKFPSLDFKHELKFIEKDGGYCKLCSRTLKNFSWSCEPCSLHFCIECVTAEEFNQQYQKLINSECDEKLQLHRHTKMSFKQFSSLKCDICGQYSNTKFGWECCDPSNKCNFSTCLACSSKFGEVMVDVKNYKQVFELQNVLDEDVVIINYTDFFKNNLNVQKKFPDIDFKHDLTFIHKEGGYCKMCSRTLKNFCWSCEQCSLYVCTECLTIEGFNQYYEKLINSECDENIQQHRHTKMKFKKLSNMICDICKNSLKMNYGWECCDPTNKCNFATCLECSSKFGEVMVDVKMYNQQFQQQNLQDEEFIIINYSDFFKKNINISKKFPEIDFKHELRFIQKNGGYCKMCSRSLKNFCWSCEQCSLYVCTECLTIDTFNQYYEKIINSQCDEKIQIHRHTKMQFKRLSNMNCDICKQSLKKNYGWECCDPTNKCNFATCLECSSSFGEIMVDPQIYKQEFQVLNNEQQDEDFIIINYSDFYKNNLNIQKKFPNLDFKHDLTFIQKDGGYCKMCSRSLKSFCWSCEPCSLYVCIECVTIEPFNQYYQKLINSECDEKLQLHRHTKLKFKKLSNVNCDICKRSCKSQYGWECSDPVNKCNFTTCLDCSSKFGEVLVDATMYKQVFEQQTLQESDEIKIINFQNFFKNKLNLEKKFPQIDFKHNLKFIEKNGGNCKMCNRSLKNFCWSCNSCQYFVCIECISIESFNQFYQKLINSQCDEKLQLHRHTKLSFKKINSVNCDVCRQSCKAQFGWSCSDPVNKCNFIICLDCSSKFGEVMVDDQIYNSLPELPDNNDQNDIQQQDDGFKIINFSNFFKSQLNFEKKFPKIDFKHSLKFIEKDGGNCKLCNRGLKKYSWSCETCKYYICIDCITVEPFNQYYQKLVSSECDEKIQQHRHSKLKFKKLPNMKCEVCKQYQKVEYGWECCDQTNKCNFNICIDCSCKFGEVLVDTTIYKSLPEIPVYNPDNQQQANSQQDEEFKIISFSGFFQNNLNIEKKFPKIDFKHNLKFIQKEGGQCKMCSRSLKNFCWSCELCKYYICIECVTIEPFNQFYERLIKSQCDEKLQQHRHSKMFFKKFSSATCDICRKSLKQNYGWECSDPTNKCNFATCLDCSSKFGEVMVDENIYKQQFEQQYIQEDELMVLNFSEFFKNCLNYEKKFPKIDFKHNLKFIEKYGGSCKLCSRSLKNYCWSCQTCNYFVCVECISFEPFNQYYQKLVNSECDEQLQTHRHTKMKFKNFSNMNCDICRKSSNTKYGWECCDPTNKCNYTVCIDCSSKFSELLIDTKVYKSLPDINLNNQDQQQDDDFMIVNFSQFFRNNINSTQKFPKIDFKHSMKFIEKNGGYCKQCSRSLKNFCWSCEPCSLYYCLECLTTEPFNLYYQKMMNSECDETLQTHRHTKMKFKNFSGMNCDICRKSSQVKYGWECSDPTNKCNFTACIECTSKFGEVAVDTKIYKSIPDYVPQMNQEEESTLINYSQFFKNLVNLKHKFKKLHYRHDLTLIDGQKEKCTLCWHSINNVCWNCKECELFVCFDCIPSLKLFKGLYSLLVNSEAEENLQNLRHKGFKFIENVNKLKCDNCREKREGEYGWICTQQGCGEFVCLTCSSNFKEVSVSAQQNKQEQHFLLNVFNILKSQQIIPDSIMQEIIYFNRDEEDEKVTLILFESIFKNNLNLKNKLNCHQNHELQLQISSGDYCSKCVQGTKDQYAWVCEPCDLKFCMNCTSSESDLKYYFDKFVNSEYDQKMDRHAHVKFTFRHEEEGKQIRCDICNRSQNNQFYYWSCTNCQKFEICLKCSLKFDEVKIDQQIHASRPNPPERQAIKEEETEEQKQDGDLKFNINQHFQNSLHTKHKFDSHSDHDLVFSDYQQGSCRKCDRSIKSYCWRCEQCNYSLCLDCSSNVVTLQYLYTLLIKSQYEQQVYNHKHNQVNFVSFPDGKSGKRCDICSRSLFYYGWKCNQCSYDICLNCSGKFETVKLDLEVYKSHQDNPQLKQQEVTAGVEFKQFFQNCLGARQRFDSHQDHELVFSDCKQGSCRKCDRSLKSFSWRCEPCNYSLCLDCTSKLKYFELFFNKLVKSSYEEKLDKHNHQQVNFEHHPTGQSGRRCDFCSKSVFYYGWKCPQCSYDVCLNCSGQFGKLKLDMEVYNSQPNVPSVYTSQ